MDKLPNFRDPDFLYTHVLSILDFYQPHAVDSKGGFFHYFDNQGRVYNHEHRHLVSSTRFIFNYALASQWVKDQPRQQNYYANMRHGIQFLEHAHFDPKSCGYFWQINAGQAQDDTHHAYGLAFVLLAYAVSLNAAKHPDEQQHYQQKIEATWQLLEQKFWQPKVGLYADEYTYDWQTLSPYRGQNANMHLCEALLTTYAATQEQHYLDRAYSLAKTMSLHQAALSSGLIWEHYDQHWQVDWLYNQENPKHLFRPWGFQPGHQTEWAKLLLILSRYFSEPWLIKTAEYLFDQALAIAWDNKHGGIHYGFAPDKTICDTDKYYWVQAESFAAAALLAITTKKDHYWQWYDKIWQYAWQHFIDHQQGGWHRILTNDNQRYSNEKSPAGKTDYHIIGACIEVLSAIQQKNKSELL